MAGFLEADIRAPELRRREFLSGEAAAAATFTIVSRRPPAPPQAASGRGGRRPQVAVGKGTIDWMTTFTAAKAAGIQSYYVEQNWELTQQSVAYLKTLVV